MSDYQLPTHRELTRWKQEMMYHKQFTDDAPINVWKHAIYDHEFDKFGLTESYHNNDTENTQTYIVLIKTNM